MRLSLFSQRFQVFKIKIPHKTDSNTLKKTSNCEKNTYLSICLIDEFEKRDMTDFRIFFFGFVLFVNEIKERNSCGEIRIDRQIGDPCNIDK